jgi:hypothetical protein
MKTTTLWVTQRAAAEELGVSERTLLRWRVAGILQPGEHFRRKYPNSNAPVLYQLERCESTISSALAEG